MESGHYIYGVASCYRFSGCFAMLNAGMIMGRISAYAFTAAQTVMATVTNIAAGAMRLFNMVVKANPLMLLISLVIALWPHSGLGKW